MLDEFFSFERFIMDLVERWDPVVPFQERGGFADEFAGVGIHLPDRIDYGMIVGIENVFLELGMPRDVNLADAIMRHIVQVIVRIEIVVF